MLRFINVENPTEIKKYVDQFDLKKSTWIVSDLKSKLDIQSQCLNKYGFFLDDSILRVSDFWRLWLRRLSPETAVVSTDFIKTLVQNFMTTEAFKSVQSHLELEPHQYTTVYGYLNELAPIILSPQSDEIMQEWFHSHNKAWQKWYLVARLCLNYLVKEKKVIDSLWIPSFIQNLDINLIQWNKHIYLDLGSEMTSVEMGLFQQMSQKVDVTVFVPQPQWKDKYKFLLNTYATHSGYSQTATPLEKKLDQPLNLNTYQRFASEALEIKFITQQVRQWIEAGSEPACIGLVSPRIEDYWPVLKIHLDEEGIAYNKKNVASLLGLGCFQLLLSKVKSLSSDVSWESLEQAYYGKDQDQSILDFEKFKAQFLELTDTEDLLRVEDIKKIFYSKLNFNEKMGRLVFLALLFKQWNELNLNNEEESYFSFLEMAFKDFLSRTIDMEFTFDQWIKIFSAGLSKKEVTLQKATANGIDVGSSNSSHLMNVKHIIWFGLDESAFRKNTNTMVPLSDIEELKFKFDFPIAYPEESHAEFNIRWYSQYNFRDQIFTCSKASAKAEPLNASSLILENNIEPDVVFDLNAQATRVDSLQGWAAEHTEDQKLKNELQVYEVKVTEYRPTELSMTDFINYDHCAFKLLAAKGFKLRDFPVTSIDLDPRQRGSLAHALFEFLITDKRYKNFNLTETENFLEAKRTEFRLYERMDDFWQVQKKKMLETASQFSRFENERIGKLALEHMVEVDFKLALKQLQISGRIDRIDIYENQLALIFDYKRSESDNTSYGVNWMEKHEFQMLFYILATESVFKLKDHGAFYFFYKNMQVFKGLIDRSATDQPLVASSVELRKKVQVDDEAYLELKKEFKNAILQLEEKLYSGVFTALPFDKNICERCDWNKLCRAAHL